jgi:hypothetical protein
MKVEKKSTNIQFTPIDTIKGEGIRTATNGPVEGVKELNDTELSEGFHKWFSRVHGDKGNPQIQAIKRDKIYFTYEGSEGEQIVFKKLIQDLWDRNKL